MIDESLYNDFALFLSNSGIKIKAVAKATNISIRTLYNYRAKSQNISNNKAARLRAFINAFQAVNYCAASMV